MNDEENLCNEGPYKARDCAFFMAYHQVHNYCRWLLFHPMDLEHYCKFELSLEMVMFFAPLLTSLFYWIEILALVCSSGKRKRGSKSLVDHWSNGRAH
jgi:hypothetical protein